MSCTTLSVVVPTRNRPDHAGPCVASILANPGSFELVLIDQSDTDATELAMQPYLRDPRFRIVRTTTTRGASNARNLGVSETSRPLIAFTDDDCRVASDWLQQIAKIFAADTATDILYGRVTYQSTCRERVSRPILNPIAVSTTVSFQESTCPGASGRT